ncbi:hypothetical protein AVEN_111426-1 [Araneus ventricosus]|uniref:Uncharacterized protein n=1 Tax=Araneus ventricosus TaxID=182803 RepID=A0A4Y2HCP1_ARAVE|nr:hypothetical protein AVEN_111426-1 [Araneus ventricosus]
MSTTGQITVNPLPSILKIPRIIHFKEGIVGDPDNTESVFFPLQAITSIAITGRLSVRGGEIAEACNHEKPGDLIGKSFFSTPLPPNYFSQTRNRRGFNVADRSLLLFDCSNPFRLRIEEV